MTFKYPIRTRREGAKDILLFGGFPPLNSTAVRLYGLGVIIHYPFIRSHSVSSATHGRPLVSE